MSAYRFGSKRLVLWTLAAVLFVGGGAAWVERASLLGWLYVRGLMSSDEAGRERWLDRVASLGEPALQPLIDGLGRAESTPCANARAGLERLGRGWGLDDPRAAELVQRLARSFPTMSEVGQQHALELATTWCGADASVPPTLLSACGKLLAETASSRNADVQARTLALCAAVLAQPQPGDALPCCREALRGSLQSPDPAQRVRAVQLALRPGLDLLEQVAPLLQDASPAVRRAAVLAVGPADQVVRDETLLPCLHDSDPDVRRLSEMALRSRGLQTEHIQIGRLLTDPSPVNRLRVLDHLLEDDDLDPGLWLRRLSHDPSPAVRAAAVRAMHQQTVVDLSDRLDQMAHSDPSPTVIELARYYQRLPKLETAQDQQ